MEELMTKMGELAWYDWSVLGIVVFCVACFVAMVMSPTSGAHESCRAVSADTPCLECEKAAAKLHQDVCMECWIKHFVKLRLCESCGRAWEPVDSSTQCPLCKNVREFPIQAIPIEVTESIGPVKGSCSGSPVSG